MNQAAVRIDRTETAEAAEAAKAGIAAFARELGFDAVGFATADQPRHVAAGLSGFFAGRFFVV